MGNRSDDGVKNAVNPEYETNPDTGELPCVSVKVDDVMVAASIAVLNVVAIF